jgi:hypothetical protein
LRVVAFWPSFFRFLWSTHCWQVGLRNFCCVSEKLVGGNTWWHLWHSMVDDLLVWLHEQRRVIAKSYSVWYHHSNNTKSIKRIWGACTRCRFCVSDFCVTWWCEEAALPVRRTDVLESFFAPHTCPMPCHIFFFFCPSPSHISQSAASVGKRTCVCKAKRCALCYLIPLLCLSQKLYHCVLLLRLGDCQQQRNFFALKLFIPTFSETFHSQSPAFATYS